MTVHDQLLSHLTEALDPPTAGSLMAEVQRISTEKPVARAVVDLLDELRRLSAKIHRVALETLPELQRRAGLDPVVSWLDLGVAVAESSGAAALKYFKESPMLIGLVDSPPARDQMLMIALELAEADHNIALDFLRIAPELLVLRPAGELAAWADIGRELSRWDYVLGVEFFRQAPAVARVLPLEDVRPWVEFGMKLITLNSLGKTDYLGTLEFFRASPALLGDVEGNAVRKRVVQLGSALAQHSPSCATTFLAETPALLRRIGSEAWRTRILQYGVLLAEQDAEVALAYLRRCPELVSLLGQSTPTPPSPLGPVAPPNATGQGEGEGGGDKFEQWFRGGMEALEYSAEGARAYFALETKKALASVEHALSGVPLRQVARSLNLFAEALCGAEVSIRSLPEEADNAGKAMRPSVSPDGRTIALPAIVRRYPTWEENLRFYTVMTAHEAGHLEFGTYQLPLGRLSDLIESVRFRYGHARIPTNPSPHPSPLGGEGKGEGGFPSPASASVQTLGDLFQLYPQPGLIRDLWTLLEDARVEWRLQDEYPGLQRDLAVLAREAVKTRSLVHGMSVREMVVDTLLLLSTTEPGTVRIPDVIADIVARLWELGQCILRPNTTAEDAVRLADQVYVLMDRLLGSAAHESQASGPQTEEVSPGPRAAEALGGAYRPVTNWAYRGAMDPELVRDQAESDLETSDKAPDLRGGTRAGTSALPSAREAGGPGGERGALSSEAVPPRSLATPLIADLLSVGEDSAAFISSEKTGKRSFLYDEWDGTIKDYRSGWCRVVERQGVEGPSDVAEAMLAAHGPTVRLLRRYFESLRPPGLRRVYGQTDGEEIDLDAVVQLTADRAAGIEPSDRLYMRREKRERDVAAVFLVDMSGSTSRQIDPERGRTVMDVEKEGLVLLSEALEAIGDQYAIYGYSGQGRHQIDFVLLKDFDEPAGARAAQRIGGMSPLHQNRDGAAIRHAARKLLGRPARVKLLVLMSDGRPLDAGYADEYSLEDTKMALREARMQGIDAFCITVDRDADDYLKRMYGEVRFLIIDRVEALPERLPRLYQQLTKS